MADSFTDNTSLVLQVTGSNSGSWGTDLNANLITIVDQLLGKTVSVAVSSTDVNLTTTQRQNLAFELTGALTNDLSVILPLNANSTTVAVGGQFIFSNDTTGSHAVTVKTVASGSTGVQVPQGTKAILYSDTTNVWFADDAQNRIQSFNGNPNGNVAGTAASASTRASFLIDRSTNLEYLCTSSGTASSAIWFPNLPFTFPCEGYLTASSDTNNVVLTADSIGATTIYYTAFRGGYFWCYNGTSFFPVPITGGQLTLALSGSSQASNGLYDVIGFVDSGTPRIAFSPAWTTATAGSGNRGTGGGTPQMTRINGVPVNAVQQTVNNGGSTYTVAANRGTILGTVWIDSSAGQVTCHRSYGQSRKFGIWNVYNRLPIILKGGDPNATWSYGTNTLRASNGNSANKVSVMCGLGEELVAANFVQQVNISPSTTTQVAIGWNSTIAASGIDVQFLSGASNQTLISEFEQTTPFIGISDVTSLEAATGSTTFNGTESKMLLTARWNG